MCYQLMNLEPLIDDTNHNEQEEQQDDDNEAYDPEQTSEISLDATYPNGYCMSLKQKIPYCCCYCIS